MARHRWIAAAPLLTVLANTVAVEAQCSAQWWPDFMAGTISPGGVESLAVFDDDGDGPLQPALYVGGSFDSAFGVTAQHIARYDGLAWSAVGSGLDGPGETPNARELAVFDEDGIGPLPPSLFVAGSFENAGGIPADGIARWDGVSWSAVGTGFSGYVSALTIFDGDGTGPEWPALYAAGAIVLPGGATSVARWDGTSWTAVGPSANGAAKCLAVFDADGAGPGLPSLYLGGTFTSIGGLVVRRIARWTGEQWVEVGGGITTCPNCIHPAVYALAVFDDDAEGPNAPALYAGGMLGSAGGVSVTGVAKWDGIAWSAVGSGLGGTVYTLTVFDDDAGEPNAAALYAGGDFDFSGQLYQLNNLAKWDGGAWSKLYKGVNDYVFAMAAFDADGDAPTPPSLYVGGSFSSMGSVPAGRLARWGTGGPPPFIEWQPEDVEVATDDDAQFHVVELDTGPVTYQWRKDGQDLVVGEDTNFSCVTDTLLIIFDVTAEDAGVYDAVVSNGCGSTASNAATLTVVPQALIIAANPPLDNPFLAGAQPFRDVLQTGNDQSVTQGIGGAATPPEDSILYHSITVAFDSVPVPTPSPTTVSVGCTGPYTACPHVTTVSGDNPFEITLSGPIPPGETATFYFAGVADEPRLRYEWLPGDVSMDGTVSASDVLSLLTAINNGDAGQPQNLPRYDVNRSGSVSTADLLRLVQLLNGINTSQVWLSANLEPCT